MSTAKDIKASKGKAVEPTSQVETTRSARSGVIDKLRENSAGGFYCAYGTIPSSHE